jgi:hypothetical protein
VPASVAGSIAMQCLAYSEEVSEYIRRDCEALSVDSRETELVDELCETLWESCESI